MHRLSSSVMVHHGGRRVAECGLVASEIGGVVAGVVDVHDPKWWFFRLVSNGDCEFLVFGDILEGGYH